MWNLVRAQAQANRAATRWFVGLLTVLLTITTYSLVEAGTQGAITRTQQSANWGGGEWLGHVSLGDVAQDDREDGWTILAVDDFTAAIDEANAEGAHVVMRIWAAGSFGPVFGVEQLDHPEIAILYGDVPWEELLVEGRAPLAAGEVVLNATVAQELGLHVGDTVAIYQDPVRPFTKGNPFPPATERLVVGITGNLLSPGYDGRDVQAYLPLAERELPNGGLVQGTRSGETGIRNPVILDADVTWDGSPASLSGIEGWYFGPRTLAGFPPATVLPLAAAFILIVGMIIMAFAVGRTQAQNRVRWVATTRTLGASSARVAVATGLETVANTFVALVIALPIGYGLSFAHLAWARNASAPSLLPQQPVVLWWAVPAVIAVALLVSTIAGAVPAFWASRVPPVAAFAPINDLTEAEVSRRLPARWVVYTFAIAMAAALSAESIFEDNLFARVLGVLGMVIVGFALLVEWLRRVFAWLGRRMARGNRPALISAGDALRARPRQATAGALLLGVGVGVGSSVIITATKDFLLFGDDGRRIDPSTWGATYGVLTSQALLGTAIALLTLQLVAIAISMGHSRALGADTALRSALGQTPEDSRHAARLVHVVPQVFGSMVGAMVPFCILAARQGWQWLTDPQPAGWYGHVPWSEFMVPSLVLITALILAVTVIAFAGGALLTRRTARGAPIDGLREAALVGAS